MYTLRIIEETRKDRSRSFEQVVENYALGNYYSLLKKGCTKEFDEVIKKDYPSYDVSRVRAIIIGENKLTLFINENTENIRYSYFVMTENGKTFERL